jgi:acetyl esterase
MAHFYELYLADSPNHTDPRISPLLSTDLHESPPTVFTVAGYDPLHDEGVALCGLLEGSGVKVSFISEPTLTHGYLSLGGISAEVRAAIERICVAIGHVAQTGN